MKLIIKWIIGIIIGYTGLLWLVKSLRKGRITILCYHRVLDDTRMKDYYRPAVAISVSTFEKQMKVLQEHKVISLEKAMDLLQKRGNCQIITW